VCGTCSKDLQFVYIALQRCGGDSFISPVIASASGPEPYRLFWDDIDKLKLADFKTEVLFDLVDTLYRQKHGLTVTGNYSMRDLQSSAKYGDISGR